MNIAVVGAGVSGLTSAIVLAEAGHAVTIYNAARAHMASPAAGAVWFLYDVEGAEAWALRTYDRLSELVTVAGSGVSLLETRVYDLPEVPAWTAHCDFRVIDGGFAVTVPMMDTPVYLRYLRARFGGTLREVEPFATLAEVPQAHDLIVNCSGVGARMLAGDESVHQHRGQVVLTAAQPSLTYGYVRESDLTYVLPRSGDCVLGGTNDDSDDLVPDDETTRDIRRRCAGIVSEDVPTASVKVGLRPFRNGGVRLEADVGPNGRRVIHNYGHGGSGFTLSWGCAEEVAELTLG